MSDRPYEFRFYPGSPAEHAARMAVIFRLVKRGPGGRNFPTNAQEWSSAFQDILHRWRS